MKHKDTTKTPLTLNELKTQVGEIRQYLIDFYGDSPALDRVKQILQECQTGLDQEMRNTLIDNQMAQRKEEAKVHNVVN